MSNWRYAQQLPTQIRCGAMTLRLELDLTVDTAAADSTAVTFSNAVGESTLVRINGAQHRYELDRSRTQLSLLAL